MDYGAGNLFSLQNAMGCLKAESLVTDSGRIIAMAERIILPGVGSFGFLMENLRNRELIEPLKQAISSGKPFLGICLGMQALFEESEESPGIKGLGMLKGKVRRFTMGKIPHIGWNMIIPAKPSSLFSAGFAYFAHSYYPVPEDKEATTATTDYYGNFTSGIIDKNIAAVQFHPEKSGEFGMELLRRWLIC